MKPYWIPIFVVAAYAADFANTAGWVDTGTAIVASKGRNVSVGSAIILSGSGDFSTAVNGAVSACSASCLIDASAFSGTISTSTTIALNKPVHLIFPSGRVNSSASPGISITSSGVTLTGHGRGISILSANNAAQISAVGQLRNISISDMGLYGASAGVALRIKTGTDAGTVIASQFRNLYLRDSVGAALWIGSDSLADASPTQASELLFDHVFIESETSGEAVKCRGAFACQVVSFRDCVISTSASFGLHVEETSGPITISGGSWGASNTTFYLEPTQSQLSLSLTGIAESEGSNQKTLTFGPRATQSAVISILGGNLGSGANDAFLINQDGVFLTAIGVEFAVATPTIRFTGAGGVFNAAGCYLGNTNTSVIYASDTISGQWVAR